jgi:eukaryotic-like serine/threonine-protein kinase
MEILGRYKIVGEAGRGGMGIVYEAFDPILSRDVAIKTMSLDISHKPEEVAKFKERFLREARAAAALMHPNIIAVYDVLQEDSAIHIIMEFVRGQTLDQVLSEPTQRPQQWCLQILEEAAAGLDYAHQRGVFHRDIKPGNIMVDSGGHTKIADFGIAKLAGQETLTESGVVLGSPHYMTPEQLKGERVSSQTDQFSLAAVAYALLTGSQPFQGDSIPRVFYKIINEPVTAPTSLNPALGYEVDRVLQKAMAKTPAERFDSCTAFMEALKSALRPGAQKPKTVKARKPVRIPSVPIGTALAVLLIVVIGFLFFGRGSKTIIVPSVVGMMKDAAVAKLESEGWLIGQASSRKSEETAGKILEQNPAAGSRFPQKGSIDLVVAEPAKVTVTVPDIVGMNSREALDALKLAGLRFGRRTNRESEKVAGTILDQNPAAGTQLEKQGQVDIVTASRIAESLIIVPSVIGMNKEEAITRLKALRLQVRNRFRESEEASGTILDQIPRAGSQLPQQGIVDVVIAIASPNQVTVPNVLGMKMEMAAGNLKRSGLRALRGPSMQSEQASGTILEQQPKAGSQLPRESQVELVSAEPILPIGKNVIRLKRGDSYHFLTGKRYYVTGGDFYLSLSESEAKFFANNRFQRGLVDLGDIGNLPLNQVKPPARGYYNSGVPAIVGHTYVSQAKAGEEGHYIIFCVKSLKLGEHLDIEFRYLAEPKIETTEVFGGPGGFRFADMEIPAGGRVVEVHIYSGEAIASLQMLYLLPDGSSRPGPRHGGLHGQHSIFRLDSDEYITGLSGRCGDYVYSIRIHTNKRTSSLFGGSRGSRDFQIDVSPGKRTVGFSGRAGDYVDAIGLTTMPISGR